MRACVRAAPRRARASGAKPQGSNRRARERVIAARVESPWEVYLCMHCMGQRPLHSSIRVCGVCVRPAPLPLPSVLPAYSLPAGSPPLPLYRHPPRVAASTRALGRKLFKPPPTAPSQPTGSPARHPTPCRSATKGAVVWRVMRDEAYLGLMLRVLSRFHTQHVLRGLPPPRDMFRACGDHRALLAHTARLARRAQRLSAVPGAELGPAGRDAAFLS